MNNRKITVVALFLLISGLTKAYTQTPTSPNMEELAKKLHPSATFSERQAISNLLRGEQENNQFMPIRLLRVPPQEGKSVSGQFALLEMGTQLMIPMGTSARIGIINHKREITNSTEMWTGWRMRIQNLDLKYHDKVEAPVFEIHTSKMNKGFDIAKQYYAMNEFGDFVLVRLEKKQGSIFQNNYSDSHFTLGGDFSMSSKEDWSDKLYSTNSIKILQALLFFSGQHDSLHNRSSTNKGRLMGDMVRLLYSKNETRTRLIELTKSPNTWIAEAAGIAQKNLAKV